LCWMTRGSTSTKGDGQEAMSPDDMLRPDMVEREPRDCVHCCQKGPNQGAPDEGVWLHPHLRACWLQHPCLLRGTIGLHRTQRRTSSSMFVGWRVCTAIQGLDHAARHQHHAQCTGCQQGELHTPNMHQAGKETVCTFHIPSCKPVQHSKAAFQPDWHLS
jgi:hypothetical protein